MQIEVEGVDLLRFADGSPVRAASGVAPLGDGYLVVQDDATHGAWVREGSGSSARRMRWVLVGLRDGSPDAVVADLAPLYASVGDVRGVDADVLNLEGACVVGDVLRWYHRGLPSAGLPSASVDLDLEAVLDVALGRRPPEADVDDPHAPSLALRLRVALPEIRSTATGSATMLGPMSAALTVCVTDDDYQAWRRVRLAVLPGERCDTVAEMREQDSPDRLLLLASLDGVVVGIGAADRAQSAGVGFVAPRVLPEHRRKAVGSALLRRLAEHCAGLGLAAVRAGVEDEGSLAFAERFGFTEVDRQVEQLRTIGDEPAPPAPPAGVEVVLLSERPELWTECYDRFGTEVLADFAVYTPLQVTAEQWETAWRADPMFLAVHDGEVVGCAGLDPDPDHPERAEHALTAVRRDWRGRGIAALLKRHTLHWAAAHGLAEVYTWTQAGNTPMLRLNERLGYVRGSVSITVSRPLPLDT